MSEEKKTMTIRELLMARNALPRVIPVMIPGFGEVRVRRVRGEEAMKFESGFDAVAAAILDETDNPLFANVTEVKEMDYALARALLAAYDEVNSIVPHGIGA